MAEPDISGGAPLAGAQPKSKKSQGTVARLGAKVTTDGVEKLTGKFKDLLGTLRNVRTELSAIQNGGEADPNQSASNNKLSAMINGFKNSGAGGGGEGGNGNGNGGAGAMRNGGVFAGKLALMGAGAINNRMNQQMQASVGISATDTFMSSRYGFSYKGAETARFNATGRFGGSREQQLAASQIGFNYGQTSIGNNQFLQSAGNIVQASGGTLNVAQAAEMAGDFTDPLVARRARGLGIAPIRINGVVQNSLSVAQSYLSAFESANGKMNRDDIAWAQSSTSRFRQNLQFKYGLGTGAQDQILQVAGQQQSFNERGGIGRLDYNNPDDMAKAGLSDNNLGLRSQALSTVVGRRDSNFFAKQEGAMVDRLGQEMKIQEMLGKTEDAFSGLIGVVYQFENAIKVVTAALGAMALMGGMGGMGLFGRGAGGVPGVPGVNGVNGVPAGVPAGMNGVPGAAGKGGMSVAARAGLGVMGGAMMVGGVGTMMQGGTANTISGGFSTMAGGALFGGSALAGVGGMGLLAATGVGAVAAGAVVLGVGLYARGKGKDAESVAKGVAEAEGMDDKTLIDSLENYRRGNGWQNGSLMDAQGGNAGPRERGRFDVWAARRGALAAVVLDSAMNDGTLTPGTEDSAEIARLSTFFSDPAQTKNDSKFNDNAEDSMVWFDEIRRKNPGLFKEYLGNVESPFSDKPVVSAGMASFVKTGLQQYQASVDSGGTGDAVGGLMSASGSILAKSSVLSKKGIGPGNASYDKLDPRMKDKVGKLVSASGGKVWINQGWRSPVEQEQGFLRRYQPDPNGDRTWRGQKWSLKNPNDFPLASPGRSNHEIGMAVDMGGDMAWLQQNAGRFGLKHFAQVNNEPHHLQLAGLPNGFLGGGDTGGMSPDGETLADQNSGMMALGGGANAASGVGYSIAGRLPGSSGNAFGVSGSFQGTGAETTAGAMGGGGGGGGGPVGAQQAAMYAYQAGFRGADLVKIVAIGGRESNWSNVKSSKSDDWGVWQINGVHMEWLRSAGLANQKSDLLDPRINAAAAFRLYSNRGGGFGDWAASSNSSTHGGGPGFDGNGDPMWNTNVAAAAEAVGAAGFPNGGDPVGPTRSSIGSGSGAVINMGGITINSTGNAQYDADAFIKAVTPKLEQVAGMATKRTSG